MNYRTITAPKRIRKILLCIFTNQILYFHSNILELMGVILFSHSSLDRLRGYGLKYEQGFKFTHLGEIGK